MAVDRFPLETMLQIIEEYDFGDAAPDPEIAGYLLVEWLAGGDLRIVALVRPGTDPANREMFAGWAASRVTRFLEHGPEPDGWQQRSDGGWQLWGRLCYLPPVD